MEKGFRILVAGWIVVLALVTGGLASYNDHLDSLPGTLIRCLPDCYHLPLCVPLLVLLAPARAPPGYWTSCGLHEPTVL